MTTQPPTTPYDASPEEALEAILAHRGPVLLDLDETLYLRNSTEDFIDSVRPGVAGLVVMRALDAVKPWRWTGGDPTRDVWRVRLAKLLFPWTTRVWKGRAGELASRYANRRLLEALRKCPTPPVIHTAGFRSIVTPLVAALGLPEATIVAARHTTLADRQRGKHRMAVEALGDEVVRRALVLTDALEDLPLLEAAARPLRTVWPEARFQRAFGRAYLPGQYLSLVKRPGKRYILRGILQEDFAFWILGSIALAASPVLHLLGLSFLLVSFWAVYERGYVDNDLVAARFEQDPKLSEAFYQSPAATPPLPPLLWALATGLVGIGLLHGWGGGLTYAAWCGVLLATHACFLLYNRLDKQSRVWLYPCLQFARSAAFVVAVPVTPIGAMALGAHVLARWVPYYVYRFARVDWSQGGLMLARLQFFLVLSALLAVAMGPASLLNWTALALLAWNVFKARNELKAVLASASLLTRR